jgi:adenylate kinase
MRLILLGPPGSGKGTQAKLLSQRQHLQHISTGDLLRQAIALDTPTGRRAKPYVESGQLVPSDLVNDMVAERFQTEPRPERFILDGYPRTVAQAHALEQVLRQQSLRLDAVVDLVVADEELVRRISGRWTCPNVTCQAMYHTVFKPPKVPGVCDLCGSKLIHREDDREETVRERLAIYHKNNADLLKYYRDQGLLRQVNAAGEIEAVYADLVKVLTEATKARP